MDLVARGVSQLAASSEHNHTATLETYLQYHPLYISESTQLDDGS